MNTGNPSPLYPHKSWTVLILKKGTEEASCAPFSTDASRDVLRSELSWSHLLPLGCAIVRSGHSEGLPFSVDPLCVADLQHVRSSRLAFNGNKAKQFVAHDSRIRHPRQM